MVSTQPETIRLDDWPYVMLPRAAAAYVQGHLSTGRCSFILYDPQTSRRRRAALARRILAGQVQRAWHHTVRKTIHVQCVDPESTTVDAALVMSIRSLRHLASDAAAVEALDVPGNRGTQAASWRIIKRAGNVISDDCYGMALLVVLDAERWLTSHGSIERLNSFLRGHMWIRAVLISGGEPATTLPSAFRRINVVRRRTDVRQWQAVGQHASECGDALIETISYDVAVAGTLRWRITMAPHWERGFIFAEPSPDAYHRSLDTEGACAVIHAAARRIFGPKGLLALPGYGTSIQGKTASCFERLSLQRDRKSISVRAVVRNPGDTEARGFEPDNTTTAASRFHKRHFAKHPRPRAPVLNWRGTFW